MSKPNGPPTRYRTLVPPTSTTGVTTTRCGIFKIPPHGQTALAVKWMSFWTPSAMTIASGDTLSAFVFVDNNPTNIPAISGANPKTVLAAFNWTPPSGTLNVINPPGLIGLIFPDPLLLAPNDDPCWVVILDNNQSTGVTQAQWDTTFLSVNGWEIPTLDLGTFPSPDSMEATL